MAHSCTKRSQVPGGALLVLAASLVSCTCMGVTAGGGPVPTPPFPIQDLLLDVSAFPDGWQAHVPHDPPRTYGLPLAVTYYGPGTGGIALHEVHTSRNPEEAAEAYADAIRFWFRDDDSHTPWIAPTELSYRSTTADQLRIGCHEEWESETQFCQVVAQYDRYVVRFHTYMSRYMTFADLERILAAIDERMALHLEKDTY